MPKPRTPISIHTRTNAESVRTFSSDTTTTPVPTPTWMVQYYHELERRLQTHGPTTTPTAASPSPNSGPTLKTRLSCSTITIEQAWHAKPYTPKPYSQLN